MPRGVINSVPRTPQTRETISQTGVSKKFIYIFFIGLTLITLSYFSPFISQIFTIQPIITPLLWAKDLILYIFAWPWNILSSLLSLLTYPLQFLYEYKPDINFAIPKISLTEHEQTNKIDTNSHKKIENTLEYLTNTETTLDPEPLSDTDNTPLPEIELNKNPEFKKAAIRQGKLIALKKLISIGAQSVSPEEIAAAHDQGRKQIKKHHQKTGALSLSPEEISEAFNRGKQEEIDKQKQLGSSSVTEEEVSIAFTTGKEQKLQELFNEAYNKSQDLVHLVYQDAVDASYISLLRIIDKELHNRNEDTCNIHEYYQYNVQIEHILSGVETTKEIFQKKEFCDSALRHYNENNNDYLADAQKETGLSYNNDSFCPPYK